MRFVNAYGRAALYATLVATAWLAILTLVVDGTRAVGELFSLLAVALYVFPVTFLLGVPVHLLFNALRIASARAYVLAGGVLGAAAALVFFGRSELAWLLPISIGFALAGAVAALTFWRHYVVP